MINALPGLALWLALASAGPARTDAPAPEPVGGEAVRRAFADESFPWYDAKAERVKPVLPSPDLYSPRLDGFFRSIGRWFEGVARWFRWLNRWKIPGVGAAGDLLVIGLFLLGLTLVLVILLELLRRYRPAPADDALTRPSKSTGTTARIEGLPAGVGFDVNDPLAEARRLRDLGDLSGAVVYLFAHQLLSLDRVKQVRLVPGRTGRQLVRSVVDRNLRRCVEPTLRLFEAVYYGHHAPSPRGFEAAWALAQEFERHLAAGEAT